jgi:hypothetical protein
MTGTPGRARDASLTGKGSSRTLTTAPTWPHWRRDGPITSILRGELAGHDDGSSGVWVLMSLR